jgi:lactose/raffinose/galactose permease
MVIIPAVFMLISVLIYRSKVKLNEKMHAEIVADLEKREGKAQE